MVLLALLSAQRLCGSSEDGLEVVLKVGLEAILVHATLEVDGKVGNVKNGTVIVSSEDKTSKRETLPVNVHQLVSDSILLLHNNATSDGKITIEPGVPGKSTINNCLVDRKQLQA